MSHNMVRAPGALYSSDRINKKCRLHAQNECFHPNSLWFSMCLQTFSEIAWISKPFFLLFMAFVFAELHQALETVALSEATPYFHKSISLTFPLEVVVHGEGQLFFTWCHCLCNCCVPAVRARPLCRSMSNIASVAVHVCRKCTWT